jgi:hypothetical protein
MATNRYSDGSDYQSRSDAAREQEEERSYRREQERNDKPAENYLRSHPSASWAEAKYYSQRKQK